MEAFEVDPRRFCAGGQSWEIRSDVSAFPRLGHEFTQGELFCRVVGETDPRGMMSLLLYIEGALTLICQRCLGEMRHALAVDHVLALARDAAELERLDADAESDAIPVENRLDLIALIEDEVLLSLPLAAMHAEGECPSRDAHVI